MKTLILIIISTALISSANISCQKQLSNQEVDRIVDAMLAHPTYLTQLENPTWVEPFANALMNNPKYIEYLNQNTEKQTEVMTKTMMEHPSWQPNPRQECLANMLIALTLTEQENLPSDSDVEKYCTWFETQYPGK